jgi:phospholipase C
VPSPTTFFSSDPFIPQNAKSEDLVHRYYQQRYQIDGGKMDRFTTGSDAIGLTQGYYDTTQLPIYKYLTSPDAPHSLVADHFFHAALGGPFLNHQWLIAAQTPQFQGALNDASSNDLHLSPVRIPPHDHREGQGSNRLVRAASGAAGNPRRSRVR